MHWKFKKLEGVSPPEVEYEYVKGQGWVALNPEARFQHEDMSLWRTGDGRIINVSDMTDSHIINAWKLLERRLAEGRYAPEKAEQIKKRILYLKMELNERSDF